MLFSGEARKGSSTRDHGKTSKKAIPIVNMAIDTSKHPTAIPWLQFDCTFFNGHCPVGIHFVSLHGAS